MNLHGVPSQSDGPSHQLASKGPGFLTLAQSSRRLLMVSTPNNQPFAGNPCNGRGFIKVPILLALIIEGHVYLLPLGTFGLSQRERTLGRYPFHHKERKKPKSNVACEGSHMKDFGGIGLVNRNHLIPSPF